MRLGLVACVLAALSASCAASTRRAPFDVSFADPTDGNAAVEVIVSIHADAACGDTAQWSTVVSRDGNGETPPSLPARTYGVSAIALDASCRVVAEICLATNLATAGDVTLVLASASRACVGDECSACRDAAVAGDDAGAHDAAPIDAVSNDAHASTDAHVSTDTGAPLGDACSRELCANGVDDDCDGLVDCDDDDCSARPICGGCTMPCP